MNKRTKLRIIGGDCKGRILPFNANKSLRPTSHRTRETLFNWLMADIENSNCLDLFSGTGALGLEALSRRANSVLFIEKDKKTFIELKRNITNLNYKKKSLTVLENSLKWLKNYDDNNEFNFNIFFIDPPFGLNMIKKIYIALEESKLIKKDSLIYVEAEKTINISNICKEWDEIKKGRSSQTNYGLFLKR